jgi:glutamate transport system substrate-binding protein
MTVAVVLAISACSGDDGGVARVDPGEFAEGSTMADLAEAGAITIGTKFDQPLFGELTEGGVPEGFDVEIAKVIASELGIGPDRITWVEALSANREAYIESGQVDIVVGTYSVTDGRRQVVAFAGPYFMAGQAMMVRADNDEIRSPEDMDGRTVCTVEGSTSADYVRENHPTATLVLFRAYADCLEPLRGGDVDIVTTDNKILAGYVESSDGEYTLVGEPFTQEPYGIGLAREDTEFRMWLNDVLEQSYEDGRWAEAWESTAGTVLGEAEPPAVDRYALTP